jgi:hypothetical protein
VSAVETSFQLLLLPLRDENIPFAVQWRGLLQAREQITHGSLTFLADVSRKTVLSAEAAKAQQIGSSES